MGFTIFLGFRGNFFYSKLRFFLRFLRIFLRFFFDFFGFLKKFSRLFKFHGGDNVIISNAFQNRLLITKYENIFVSKNISYFYITSRRVLDKPLRPIRTTARVKNKILFLFSFVKIKNWWNAK